MQIYKRVLYLAVLPAKRELIHHRLLDDVGRLEPGLRLVSQYHVSGHRARWSPGVAEGSRFRGE